MTSTSEIKAQLWTAASRLQRAQSKFEALAQASRRDIASSITRELQLRSSDTSSDGLEHEKSLSSLRLKAEKLIVDDQSCDLMGLLERYCDILSEGRLSESAAQLDQDCLEAVSGILAASSRVDSPELRALSNLLAQRYPDLIMESELRENVSPKIGIHLNPGRPPQTIVDEKIVTISQSQGLGNWVPPGLLPAERQQEITRILGLSSVGTTIIDEGRLRQLCSYALPSTVPAWLRLRVWSILLGILPVEPLKWHSTAAKGRADYLALSQQILETLSSAPLLDGSSSLSTKDKALLQFSKDVEALPGSVRDALSHCIAPSSSTTDDSVELRHTDTVNARLYMIKNRNRPEARSTQITPLIPTITLDDPPTSPFSPTALYTNQTTLASTPTVLLPSESTSSASNNILLRLLYIHSMLHSSHATSLGPPSSLAAIFAIVLTLALQAQSTPSELLYSNPDTVPNPGSMDSLIQIEADVFWMVEAIVGNTRELLEGGDEGDEIWTRKFSNVVRWADNELWMDLSRKGLDPALPYYSYRWIPTLFTHTLPLDSLLPIWDTIFSVSNPRSVSSQHGMAPHAEFIYTLGATMLIRARVAIFQSSAAGQSSYSTGNVSPSGGLTSFWKRQTKAPPEIALPHSPSPYSPVASPKTPLSPTVSAAPRDAFSESYNQGSLGSLTPGRLSNVFLVAVKLLQEYDVNSFGGIDRLLGATWSLWRRWCREGPSILESPSFQDMPRYVNAASDESMTQSSIAGSTGGVAAGLNRLRDLAWKGITNEVEDDSDSPSPVEPNRSPTPRLTITSPGSEKSNGTGFFSSIGSGLGSKLTESVWKGVTNQLDSPDPSPEVTPEPSPRSSMLVADDEVQPRTTVNSAISSSWTGEGALSWAKGYADKLKVSETATNLSRTGTSLREKASTAWTRNVGQDEQQGLDGRPANLEKHRSQPAVSSSSYDAIIRSQSGTVSPATSSVGSWGEMFSKRGSLPMVGSFIADSRSKDGSESSVAGSPALQKENLQFLKRESYSPPARPSSFRSARDSVMGTIFSPIHTVSSPDQSHLPNSPLSAEVSKNPLQAALAALSGSPKVETPKRGPKPLLLNSGSLITPSSSRSGLSSRTPSRRPSPSPTPTPRAGDRFSMSTEGDDHAFNSSGIVSLRRGPLTNPRTAGYDVSNTSREGTRSSRASTSSGMSSPALSAREFSLDLDSEAERRRQSTLSKKSSKGFLVDHGPQIHTNGITLEDPPVILTEPTPREATVQAPSSDESQTHQNSNEDIRTPTTQVSTKPRSKRHQNRPAPIATDSPSMSVGSLPELMITTPRSGENTQRHIPRDSEDGKDLTVVGTPASTVGGATLNRSRSSTRRVKKSRDGSADDRTPRAVKRPASNYGDNRDSMLSVGRSGSEEEGAKADVEDMDDIYGMY